MDKIIQGDCLIEMRKMKENSVDTVICDPPYALGFMGKAWDRFPSDVGPKKPFANQSKEQKLGGVKFQEWTEKWAKEALRVAKPGATLLCFGGTRTYHRMACAIEDAGWILKDCLLWIYGQGFPKSHNISKALTKEYNGGKMVVYDEEKTKQNIKSQMCGLWKAIIHKAWIPQKDYNRGAMQELLEEMDKDTQYEIFTYSRSESKNTTISERREKSRLERWSDIQKKKGTIWKCEICKMSTGFYINGKKRWLCYGASFIDGKEIWEMLDENGMCSSYQSQSRGQQNRKPNVICDKCRTQIIREWEGYGSALKPAYEPIILAIKSNEGSYADNALKHGVAGLNIDGGRIGTEIISTHGNGDKYSNLKTGKSNGVGEYREHQGRFPANIILDKEAAKILDEQSGELKQGVAIRTKSGGNTFGGNIKKPPLEDLGYQDKGGASRFFKVI